MSDVLGRLTDVEKVNARLEEAALVTSRALAEVSGHWDAVYEGHASQRPLPGSSRALIHRAPSWRREYAIPLALRPGFRLKARRPSIEPLGSGRRHESRQTEFDLQGQPSHPRSGG